MRSSVFCAFMLSTLHVAASYALDMSKPVRDVVAGNNEFACALYAELAKEPGNLFFSPYSISTALAMTYAGAREETERQMARALRFDVDQARLHAALGTITDELNQSVANRILIANSLWPQADHPFLESYVSLVREHYGVDVTPVDYKRETEAARLKINDWVSKRTEELIRDLIAPGILDPMTRLVIVNAIYFKGLWEIPFETNATREADFHVTPEKAVKAQLMSRVGEFDYAEFPGVQLVELPYKDERLSMLVILPESAKAMDGVEHMLSRKQLDLWIDMMSRERVRVSLPRFKLEWGARSLNKALIELGMTDAFDEVKARFTGIDGDASELYISAVLHKAFVEVNEEGTEAAAATAVVMAARGLAPKERHILVDRPFLILIRDRATGSLLFMGRVEDPS